MPPFSSCSEVILLNQQQLFCIQVEAYLLGSDLALTNVPLTNVLYIIVSSQFSVCFYLTTACSTEEIVLP